MVFDVKIIEKTTGNVIDLKNVSYDYFETAFKDHIKQLWSNEKLGTHIYPKRVAKKRKSFKEPKI